MVFVPLSGVISVNFNPNARDKNVDETVFVPLSGVISVNFNPNARDKNVDETVFVPLSGVISVNNHLTNIHSELSSIKFSSPYRG